MKTHCLLAWLLTALMTLSVASGREIDLTKPSSKLRRFTSDVIFVVEAGDREKYSKRLPGWITVRYHGEAGPRAIAEKQLAEFCGITGIKIMEGAAAKEGGAEIEIYFGRQVELAAVAREMDGKIKVDRGFSYWTWWDRGRVIRRAVIFMATDKLSGEVFEDRLIEQLCGVFGLPARSKEFDESCMSSEEQVLTRLQPLDKAVLEFYYRAVPAGLRPREVDKIFRERWLKKP